MDWRQLLADKRVRYGGLAAAGLAGGVVLWRRFRSTGSTTAGGSVPPASQPTGTTGSIASTYPNTTGTDVAYWVGQYDQNQQAAMAQYLSQIQDALGRLQTAPTASGPHVSPAQSRLAAMLWAKNEAAQGGSGRPSGTRVTLPVGAGVRLPVRPV